MSILEGSRRQFLRGVAALAGASACGSLIAAEGSNKITKEEASYQETPREGERCSGCMLFNAESKSCQVVQGAISPEGWCRLYTPTP